MEQYFPRGVSGYALGGLMVGLGVALVFAATGIRAGASGFLSTIVGFVTRSPRSARYRAEGRWRLPFTIGLMAGGAVAALAIGGSVTEVAWWRLAAGGVLVGLGTRMARGCTSGHGICGLSSRSPQSLLHVVIFMAVAIATAHVVSGLAS